MKYAAYFLILIFASQANTHEVKNIGISIFIFLCGVSGGGDFDGFGAWIGLFGLIDDNILKFRYFIRLNIKSFCLFT